jgi:adenine C2-methylase RlmN of 23S rRNA A2503 and tRNA A37
VNDAPVHADRLARLLRSHDLRSHVNVIPFNAVEGAPFESPSRAEAIPTTAATCSSAHRSMPCASG